jgi:predicted membrane-bound mannosyltransferase
MYMIASVPKTLIGRKAHSLSVNFSIRAVSNLLQRRAVRYTLLGIATAAGLGLRYYRLGKWSFWRDEIFSVGDQEDGFNYTPLRHSISLYLIRQVVRRWGVDERKARLVPALFGALSVPLLYPILSRAFSPPVALYASILLAISHWHLYWSQNARFYTLLLLFYSLALFTFYLGLEEDRPSLLIASLLFLGLATK